MRSKLQKTEREREQRDRASKIDGNREMGIVDEAVKLCCVCVPRAQLKLPRQFYRKRISFGYDIPRIAHIRTVECAYIL